MPVHCLGLTIPGDPLPGDSNARVRSVETVPIIEMPRHDVPDVSHSPAVPWFARFPGDERLPGISTVVPMRPVRPSKRRRRFPATPVAPSGPGIRTTAGSISLSWSGRRRVFSLFPRRRSDVAVSGTATLAPSRLRDRRKARSVHPAIGAGTRVSGSVFEPIPGTHPFTAGTGETGNDSRRSVRVKGRCT